MNIACFKWTTFALIGTVGLSACSAESEPLATRTSSEIIAASVDSDWRELDPDTSLYMDLNGRRIVIELAPDFAPEHVQNIQTLAREGYWDGLSIYRSQDNFVVQFGDPAEADARKALGSAKAKLPAEFSTESQNLNFTALPDADGWAPQVGFVNGFAVARDPSTKRSWLAHCYGVLGAGRDMAIDSSNGSELYVVTGQSPRQLDLNITTVGRVVEGMEWLSSLPRGPAPMGFYANDEERSTIQSIRLGSQLEASQRSELQIMRTDTTTFTDFVESRRNRRDQWYVKPAGHIDLCNIQVPSRMKPKSELK